MIGEDKPAVASMTYLLPDWCRGIFFCLAPTLKYKSRESNWPNMLLAP